MCLRRERRLISDWFTRRGDDGDGNNNIDDNNSIINSRENDSWIKIKKRRAKRSEMKKNYQVMEKKRQSTKLLLYFCVVYTMSILFWLKTMKRWIEKENFCNAINSELRNNSFVLGLTRNYYDIVVRWWGKRVRESRVFFCFFLFFIFRWFTLVWRYGCWFFLCWVSAVRFLLPIRDNRFSFFFFTSTFPSSSPTTILSQLIASEQKIFSPRLGGEPFYCYRCPKNCTTSYDPQIQCNLAHDFLHSWYVTTSFTLVDFCIFDKCEICRLRITYFQKTARDHQTQYSKQCSSSETN